MSNKPDTTSIRLNWFRWLPRFFLLAALIAALAPFFINLWEWHWQFNLLLKLIDVFLTGLPIVIIIIIVAWLRPVSGGVVVLLASLLLFLYLVANPANWIKHVLSGDLSPLPLVECVLLFIGGILSIVWGRICQSTKAKISHVSVPDYARHSWFRWLSRGFLLMAALLPIFYQLSIRHHDFVAAVRVYSVPILFIIALIVWPAPLIGGSLAIITAALYFLIFLNVAHTSVQFYSLFRSLEFLLLFVGGVLSVIWGVLLRRWKGDQPDEYGWL